MKILYVSPEAVPFAKTGGLADVAGALPLALSHIGHEVTLVLPRYGGIDLKRWQATRLISLPVVLGDSAEEVTLFSGRIENSSVQVIFIDHPRFFGNRRELYQEKGVDFPDNFERFVTFSKAVVEAIGRGILQADIIHSNDWQSALVICFAKAWSDRFPVLRTMGSVYSVHNMGYHGLFGPELFPHLGLPGEYFTPETLEFWGKIALSKAGFVFADVINTVSPTYAQEIQTPEFGFGLDGLLRHRQNDLFGILNGIDYELWDPRHDPALPAPYDADNLAGKWENKRLLQKEFGLRVKDDIPLIGIISRLADQKGFDILGHALPKLLDGSSQWVILGTGDQKYHRLLETLHRKHPDLIGVALRFDAAAAQHIYAGSDFFHMPSHYEPCGLGQLISFRYGTIPIVRKTGGLADTVVDIDRDPAQGTGFVFEEYSSVALIDSVRRAIRLFGDPTQRQKLIRRIMALDYSWESSATQYVSLYEKAKLKTLATAR